MTVGADAGRSPWDELNELIEWLSEEIAADASAEPLVDDPSDHIVIDLRDRAPAPRDRRFDPTLALVLNRARFRTLGTASVSPLDQEERALAELANLVDRVPLPDVADLVRQAARREPAPPAELPAWSGHRTS